MLVFLSSVLAEFIAGLAVWAITEGPSRSSGQQKIIIERAFFIDSLPIKRGPSSGRSTFDEDDLLGIGIACLFIAFIVIAMIVGIAAVYVQHINLILGAGFYTTIALAIVSGVLLILGLIHYRKYQDCSVAQTAFYSLVLCAAFGGLVWLIYAPPNAPPEYDEVFLLLEDLSLGSNTWMSEAIDIGFDHWPAVRFLFFQAVGILPMFASMVIVLYTQIRVVKALREGEVEHFSIYVMIVAPAVAFIASVSLGLFG